MNNQLYKARREIVINQIDELYPVVEGKRMCTWQRPMPQYISHIGKWKHPEDAVHETDYDSDYYIEYKCDACGHTWKSEIPD
jgi:hypothetical protein